MEPATEMGGSNPAYPSTLWTAVLKARDRNAAGFRDNLGRLIRAYWKPVYWTLRTRWGQPNDQAKDLCQAFFASFLEKDRLSGVSPDKGRFRTFLRVVLDNFMRNELEAAQALKRGGEARIFSIDAADEEVPIPAETLRPEEIFDRAWAIHVFQVAVGEMKSLYLASGREIPFRLFERHELEPDPPSASKLAEEFNLPAHEVENRLKQARTDLARLLRERIRETLTDGARLEDELRTLKDAMR